MLISLQRSANALPPSLSALLIFAAALFVGGAQLAIAERPEIARLDELIGQLSSSQFTERESATAAIWAIGPAANDSLTAALPVLEADAKLRARHLLLLNETGLTPDSDPELVQLVYDFDELELEVRQQVIERLSALKQPDLMLNLLERVDDLTERRTIFDSDGFRRLLGDAVLTEDDGRIDRLMTHEIVRDSLPVIYTWWQWKHVGLDEEIGSLSKKVAAGVDASAAELLQSDRMRLMGLYRLAGRYDSALELAKEFEDSEAVGRMVSTLLMESGDWQSLAEIMVDADAELDAETMQLPMVDPLQAIVYYYAGDMKSYRRVIEQMEQELIELENDDRADDDSEQDPLDLPDESTATPAEFARIRLAEVLLQTLDWEGARKHFDFKPDLTSLALSSLLNRYDDFFESVGMPNEIEPRMQWFDKRIASVVDPADTEDGIDMGRTWSAREFQLVSGLSGQIANLGMDEEAEYYYRKLWLATDTIVPVSYRSQILRSLAEMNAVESMWQLIDNWPVDESEFELVQTIAEAPGSGFPESIPWVGNGELAEAIDIRLQRYYRNPIERARVVLSVMNSPYRDPRYTIDLERELKRLDVATTPAMVALLRSEIYERHGDEAASNRELEIATRAGEDPRPMARTAEAAYRAGDFATAADLYHASALVSRESEQGNGYYHWARAADACYRTGDVDRAKRMELMMLLDGEIYMLSPTKDLFQLPEILQTMQDWVMATNICYAGPGHLSPFINQQLAIGSDPAGYVPSLEAAVNLTRIAAIRTPVFRDDSDLDINDHRRYLRQLAATGVIAAQFQARLQIEQGNYDGARTTIQRLYKFSTANSGIAEFANPALQRLGQNELAEETFGWLADEFRPLLESYPLSSHLNNNFAWVCATARKRKDLAVLRAELAVEHRPNRPGYIDTLAEALHARGENEPAIEMIERAIRIAPGRGYMHDQRQKFERAMR